MRSVRLVRVLIVPLCCLFASSAVRGDDLKDRARKMLRRAVEYYHGKVAVHGGYVYYYSPDLSRRLGEGVAQPYQIWVQPPGTPTVGLALLEAYDATGDEFYLNAATDAAEALLYGQLESGAWTNSISFDPQGKDAARYRNGKGAGRKGRNFSTLDDGISQTAIRFLVRADAAHEFKHKQIHEGVQVALDALLKAQFPNGGFPQGWDETPAERPAAAKASYPKYDWRTEGRIKNYWDMYTLNDGVAGNVADTLIAAWEVYKEPRYKAALAKLGDFLIDAQMPEPQPAWAQQYNYRMQPIWARKFEPPAVSGRESQDAMFTLLKIFDVTGDRKYLKPIPAGVAYLEKSKLPDGRLPRYNELETNRPLYMVRSGKTYSLTYDDSRLPSHYGWKVESRLDDIKAAYQRATETGRSKTTDNETPVSAAEVRTIVSWLDDQGRWVSTFHGEPLPGQPKFREGDRYLHSGVFSENVTRLSEFLAE